MTPIKFKECNITFAKDQLEYIPLPAHIDPQGKVTTCWKFTLCERFKALIFGKIYLSMLTFNKPLHPLRLYFREDKNLCLTQMKNNLKTH